MNSDLSLGIELLMAAFTILYIAHILFSSKEGALSGLAEALQDHYKAGYGQGEKRSLLNQHVVPRAVAR